MDAGSSSSPWSSSSSSSSLSKSLSRFPFQELQIHQGRTSRENLDRFIPNRSAMDFDYAHYMVTEGRKKGKENSTAVISPSSEAYQKLLAETFNMNRTRILAFKNKPPVPVKAFPGDFSATAYGSKPIKPHRYIPKTPERTLRASAILNDYYLNLLDWGSCNVLSCALENEVPLWDASDGTTSNIVTVDEEIGPVTSVKWAPDGQHLAIGLNNSDVQLWDAMADRLLGTLKGGHQSRVGSLDWNNDTILTTGGMDGQIINNDVRVRAHIVQTYRGHHQEVSGLKWSASGRQLASGGIDNLLHIWDRSMASSSARTQWLHRLEDTATVKALAWCPFQGKLLASGGGEGGRCIKFWNTHTGACLNSVYTGSQVCALLWNNNERELLSSHGFTQNQLSLWRYPSMVKIAELTGHTSRVLFMAQSPNGCTVASAAGDETVRLWNVFGTPGVAKRAPKTKTEPFANLNRIR